MPRTAIPRVTLHPQRRPPFLQWTSAISAFTHLYTLSYSISRSLSLPDMSGEGLTRRRAGIPAPAAGSSSTGASETNTAPVQVKAPSSTLEGRGKIAYDPRDFEDKGEANKMPRLTIMEEILLLGLKDKAVRQPSEACAHGLRATFLFGTTTSHTRCEDVYSSNSPLDVVSPWSEIHHDAGLP